MKQVITIITLGLMPYFCSGQIINFPDASFKYVLVNTMCVDLNSNGVQDPGDSDVDLNNDGEVDVEEALKVKILN